MRHVGCDELDSAVHQRGNEGDVTTEPVEFGDDELGLQLLAGRERGAELRAIVSPLAALDLRVLGGERPVAAVKVVGHGLTLRVEAKPALALAISRDSVIGDPLAGVWLARLGR